MKLIKYFVPILFLGTLLYSCKTPDNIAGKAALNMPFTYIGNKDTASIAAINWKDYFRDKNLIVLIDTALKNNQDVLIAAQRIKAAQSNVLLNKGALKPVLGVGGTASLRKFGLYTMDGAGNITTEITPGKIVPTDLPDYFVGLQTSWEIDLWGKLRNRKRAAVARFLSSVEGRNMVITNLITELAITYFELQSLDNQLMILDETIALQQDALDIVQVQNEVGTSNLLAVEQYEAQLLNIKTMKLAIQQAITESESKINFLLGRYPQSVLRDTIISMTPVIQAGIPSNLLKYRPDIRQAEYELAATKADVKAAKAAFYPTINITGSLGLQAFRTDLIFTTPESIAYGVFGNLAAPILNRSAIKAEFRRANASQLEALYNYQKTILNGYVEVYNELARIKRLEESYILKKRQTEILTNSINTSSELYNTGRANYLEVLIAQQNALQAKLELAETRKNQNAAMVNIYKALGGGWQ